MQSGSRITIAISAAAAFIIMGIGLAGVANASDAPTDLTLEMPRPMAGDNAHYSYVQVDDPFDGGNILDGPLPGMEIGWRSPRIAVDFEGKEHMTNGYHEKSWGYYDRNGTVAWNEYSSWIQDYDVITDDVVSSWVITEENVEQTEDGRERVWTQGQLFLNERFDDPEMPSGYRRACGMQSSYQGESSQVRAETELFGDCHFVRPGGTFSFGGLHFRPVGLDQIGETEAVHFTASFDGRLGIFDSHVWLSEDFPYPVKYAYARPDQTWDVYYMTQFVRGDEELATEADDVEAGAGLVIGTDDRVDWGLTSNDLVPLFPISEAWSAIMADANVSAMLEAQPEAVAVRIGVDSNRLEQGAYESWDRVLWYLEFSTYDGPYVVRANYKLINDKDTFGEDLEPREEIKITMGRSESQQTPSPDSIPDSVPRLADVKALWRELGTSNQTANNWGMNIYCGDDDCEMIVTIVEVGYRYGTQRNQYDPEPLDELLGAEPRERTVESEIDTLTLRFIPGRAPSFDQFGYRYDERPATTSEPMVGGAEPAEVLTSSFSTPLWVMPTAGAIALVGIGGFLTAAIIAAGPAIKGTMLVPLFSRFQSPQLLEHPLRRRLLDQLNDRPGMHLQALADALETPRSTIHHHLSSMRRGGLIGEQATGGYTCYFPRGRGTRPMMSAAPVIKAAGAQQILRAIAGSSDLDAAKTAKAAGLSLSTTYYHLRRLQGARLIENFGGTGSLRLTGTGKSAVDDLL